VSTISVDYDVLNQRGSPAWFTDTFANIPTAGFKGRMFISTDTFAFYRDTGTGWDLIGGPGTGTLTGSGVSGQVSFFNGTQTITGNNNLFWDNVNSRLGINTTTPGAPLDIHATGTNAQFNGTGSSNAYLVFQNAGSSKWRIGNTYNAGANSFDIYNNGLTTNAISIENSSNDITLTGNMNNGVKVITTGGLVSNTILVVKNTGSVTGTNGFSSFSGNAANNGFTFAPNNSSYHRFITPTTGNYDYTLPATTGTLALTSDLSAYVTLATAQTISGAKTFTQNLALDGNGSNAGTLLLKSNTISPVAIGYASINNNGNNINLTAFVSATKTASLDLSGISDNIPRTFTLPNSTGTLALTSDLSSYLPLTGGTLTGALVINPTNTLTIGLDVASNTTRFRSDNLEGNKRQLEIVMGSGTLVQLTAKGYLANYGTDMAFYTATTSGVNASPGIYITGTNNRVGIKTGLPSYDLDVAGTFGVSSTSYFANSVGIGTNTYNSNYTLMVANTTASGAYIGTTNLAGGNGDRVLRMGFASAATIATIQGTRIATADDVSIAMQAGGGNVLIGKTTDDGNKLQIQGYISINATTTGAKVISATTLPILVNGTTYYLALYS